MNKTAQVISQVIIDYLNKNPIDDFGLDATDLAEHIASQFQSSPKWVRADTVKPTNTFDTESYHYKLDGRKVDGYFILSEPPGLMLVFEYYDAAINGYSQIEDLRRVEWLDESNVSPQAAKYSQLEIIQKGVEFAKTLNADHESYLAGAGLGYASGFEDAMKEFALSHVVKEEGKIFDIHGKQVKDGDNLIYIGTSMSGCEVRKLGGRLIVVGPFTAGYLSDWIAAPDFQSIEIVEN